jgi:hypothetical protein
MISNKRKASEMSVAAVVTISPAFGGVALRSVLGLVRSGVMAGIR